MTQEDKELLLKDLSARLPYGVCVEHTSGFRGTLHDITVYFTYNDDDTIKDYMCYTDFFGDESCKIEFFKPYLYPLSSMTDEQIYNSPIDYSQITTIKANRDWERITIKHTELSKLTDWFNRKHFDWRGLIKKGLAIDATGKNIY